MIAITDKEFKLLTEYIKSHFGINLKPEKRALVVGRLQHVLMEQNFHSFSEYYDYMTGDKSGRSKKTINFCLYERIYEV